RLPPWPGAVAGPRHGVPAPPGHATRHVPQARRSRPRLSLAPAHGRSGRRGHARRGADRVLLRSHHHARLRGCPRAGRRARDPRLLRLAHRPRPPAFPRLAPPPPPAPPPPHRPPPLP